MKIFQQIMLPASTTRWFFKELPYEISAAGKYLRRPLRHVWDAAGLKIPVYRLYLPHGLLLPIESTVAFPQMSWA